MQTYKDTSDRTAEILEPEDERMRDVKLYVPPPFRTRSPQSRESWDHLVGCNED